MQRRLHLLFLFSALALLALSSPATALAAANASYTEIGRNINIGPNDQVGDLTCIACSIRIRGQVAGDVTSVAGNIVIENPAQIAGDVTAVGGNVHLDRGAKIAGDATVVAGDLRRDPAATIAGDVTTVGGHDWMIPILLAPFIVLGLLAALVVWLVQRARRPALPAAAA
jgi:hypothetical protein